MTIYDNVFPLGLGTNRFPLSASATTSASTDEIDRCAEIVLRALDLGVNYIDTAVSYSGWHAPEVLRRALCLTNKPYRITTKVSSRLNTADAVENAVEQHLTAMGIDHASDLMVWSIFSYDEFLDIMRPGGVYEGALRLKDEKIVDYITCSIHAPANDIIKILKENVFSGMMLSMSVLNSVAMQPALDYAYENKIGTAVMNPLGGGFIPQKKEQFSFLLNEREDSIIQSALRFVKAHPAVKIVVAGPASVEQLEEDVSAFTAENPETDTHRLTRVSKNLSQLGDFCSGCRYCEPCPKGIPIPVFMQSRNALLFDPPQAYRCTDMATLKNIQVFKRLDYEFSYMPETSQNPCIQCGECERRCTQRLPVRACIADMYTRMEQSRYSRKARKARLDQLLNGKGYQKVAIWPGGAPYGDFVVQFYQDSFGEPPFKFVYFNSSPALFGHVINGHRIYAPDDLPSVKPDCILIVSYTYREEIAQSLEKYKDLDIDVLKLHMDSDVPWLY